MLIDKIQADVFSAMKSGDKKRINALRFLLAAIKRFETDNYPPGSPKKLSDADTVAVVRKQIKERQESITAYTQGKRPDLVEAETQELNIIQTYVPPQISEVDVRIEVKKVLAKGTKDFGQVMKSVMGVLKGQADGSMVAKIVKKELQK